jgi:hypothetical protein
MASQQSHTGQREGRADGEVVMESSLIWEKEGRAADRERRHNHT